MDYKNVIHILIVGVLVLSGIHLLSPDFHDQYRFQQVERAK